ncbi:hypothetical protein ASE92_09845 [Pedobacter sp. Leaf41]|nr:hypothetical protein ASE92_09845 [Pedobacter sp. Leaf41]
MVMVLPSFPSVTAVRVAIVPSTAATTRAERSGLAAIAALSDSADTSPLPKGIPSIPPNLNVVNQTRNNNILFFYCYKKIV